MLAEAVGLVNTLDNWTVVDTIILSTKTPEKKRIFGKGNFQSLTGIIYWHNSPGFYEPSEYLSVLLLSPTSEKIRQTAGITAVFVNVEHLSPLSEVSFCDICPLTAYWRSLCTNWLFCMYRGSWRKPGGLRFLTDTQWSSTFSAAMHRRRRPNFRFL